MTDRSEFLAFDKTVRTILTVSRDELKRREEEWKRSHSGRKAGRKPSKNSVSDRVSTARD